MIIAGTGHRPKYFPCKYDENDSWAISIKDNLRKYLSEVKPTKIITGMAIGWDMWLAEAALELNILLDTYIPFPGQEKTWPKIAQDRYNDILSKSTNKYFSTKFTKNAYFIRDQAMVDDCHSIVALWCGIESGGTYWTIKYAQSKNKPITNFWI